MKKISIVFMETGLKDQSGNQPFNCYLEGFSQKSKTKPDSELSAAEFWSKAMFAIVVDNLNKAGVIKTVMPIN